MPKAINLNPRYHVIYAGLLMSLSAFSIDISLPFFPAIANALNAPLSAMISIVTVFLFFLALGNLVFGPLSDKYGRKPVLIATLISFICGALLSGVSETLTQLLVGRALQGFSVGAVVVLATAMLRDLFTGQVLAKNMAVASGIFSIGPIVAPLLGVGLAELGGSWRIVFYATAVYAGLLLAFMLVAPETLQQKSAKAMQPSALWRNSKAIIAHPQSGYFLLISSITMIPMITIVSTGPALFNNEFGVSGTQFALLFALHGTGIILGQVLNHRLIPVFGIVKTAMLAAMVMVCSTLMIILFATTLWLNQYWLSFFITLFAVGYLSVIANSLSMVLQPHGEKAGLAASLRGALGMMVASLSTSVLSLFVQHSALNWGTCLFVFSLLSTLLLFRWTINTTANDSNPALD